MFSLSHLLFTSFSQHRFGLDLSLNLFGLLAPPLAFGLFLRPTSAHCVTFGLLVAGALLKRPQTSHFLLLLGLNQLLLSLVRCLTFLEEFTQTKISKFSFYIIPDVAGDVLYNVLCQLCLLRYCLLHYRKTVASNITNFQHGRAAALELCYEMRQVTALCNGARGEIRCVRHYYFLYVLEQKTTFSQRSICGVC